VVEVDDGEGEGVKAGAEEGEGVKEEEEAEGVGGGVCCARREVVAKDRESELGRREMAEGESFMVSKEGLLKMDWKDRDRR
jgi:hypothetical protein